MSDDTRRREAGESDSPIEDELQESFDRIVSEGAQRLHRTWRAVLITGFFGGIDVGVGVLAYLGVMHETGDPLLAGLAFGIGFVVLLLAKSELFTEDFLLPVTAVAAKEAKLNDLAKLWSGTLVANLVAGWLITWLIVLAFPDWTTTVVDTARHYVDPPFSVETAVLAILAGSTITLMTRMQSGTESDGVKVAAAMAGGFLLAGFQLFHSILDSLLIFAGIHAGAGIGYLDWLRFFVPTLLLNVVGGLVLVTALRLVRTKELVEFRRHT